MEKSAISAWVAKNLEGLDTVEAGEDVFWFYDPDGTTDPKRRMPLATLVNSNAYDTASNLDRPGIFRLNIGITRGTYTALFGEPPRPAPDWGVLDTGSDYTALDKVMPHPIYAPMAWVCVLNPSRNTFELMKSFLAEAHYVASERHGPKKLLN